MQSNLILYLLILILLICIYYLYQYYKNQQVITNKSVVLSYVVISILSSIAIYLELNPPIDSFDLAKTRERYIAKYFDTDDKRSKLQIHSIVPFIELNDTIDTLLAYHSKYRNIDKKDFRIACLDIAYDTLTALKYVEYLNPERKALYCQYYKLNCNAQDINFQIRNKLTDRPNKSYAIVHNDTLLNDILTYRNSSNQEKTIHTKLDFGNLCPPECDEFSEDPGLIKMVKSRKDSTELAKMFKIPINLYNRDGTKKKH